MNENELKRTWDAALGDIQLQMTRATFDTWMKGTELVDRKDGHYVISTPSPYAVEWLENRLRRMIKQTLERHVGKPISLRFIVRSALGETNEARAASAASALPTLALSESVPQSVDTTTAALDAPSSVTTTRVGASATPIS
ncbi:MAG: DnaA N-terminal domain-containing protein, partial [Candidatus Binatia bacterium]